MSFFARSSGRGRRLRRLLLLVAPGALLAGCGGGDGGVDIASGQDPDPVVVDVPVAYVMRPLPADDQGNPVIADARVLDVFDTGADLYVRDRASPSATARNITAEITQGLGDVRDLDVSYDGERILFAMRGPFAAGLDDDEQPSWNIWEYDIAGDTLRRIIAPDITAEAGHDVAPHFLPDGRIVFSSTRQRKSGAVLLDEGKPQFAALDEDRNEKAFVLHVMDADGTDIRQVSFNQSHDLDPAVLSSGQVVFTRWDNAGGNDAMHLYRMNPDGTALELLYGAGSHDFDGVTAQFLKPREMPDGRILTIVRPFLAAGLGGRIVAIDVSQYIENTQPNAANAGVLTGPAQAPLTVNDVRLDGISPGGYFSAAFPLRDGTDRMLVSWSACRLIEDELIVPCTPARLADPAAVPAPPLYGIWVYDMAKDTQLPVLPPEEGMMFTEIVAAESRTLPAVRYDKDTTGELDPDLLAEDSGLLNIRSVYDVDGVDAALPDIATLADPAQTLAADRPARFLRVVKAVGIPDDDVLDFPGTAFGRSAAQGMREIVGYAPIEPDGSVIVKVPANVPLAVSVLDARGRRIGPRHQNWLQLRPGFELRCTGCHDPTSGLSHGRQDAFDSAWPGAAANGQPFPNAEPAIFADAGETMAEARARVSCATDCAAVEPSLNVLYTDIWTDEAAAGRPKDPDIAYLYDDLDTNAPVTTQCATEWAPLCRAIINYETHIHPLWSVDRRVFDTDGVTVLEDRTCIRCHAPADDMGMTQVPSGQLDLSDGLSADEPDHFRAYRELLFADNEQELSMGALQDRLVQVGTDPDTGDPVFAPVTVPPSMSTAGTNASPAFFGRFDFGGSHAGDLTGAELRLLAEWLDIGGQYFNNPFDVPTD